jgi:exoribonuclease R
VPRSRLRDATAELAPGFAAIRAEMDVAERFSDDVEAAASRLASTGPAGERADRRDVELTSVDPAGSRDLDQAFRLDRRGAGYRFRYAIADVGAWLAGGGPVEAESRRRGTTIYCPDTRIPLHPVRLSEGAASLLPGQERPAVLWTIDLDQRGEVADVAVERATVRNRRALAYDDAQEHLDAGGADDQLRLLAEVGRLREAVERARGGVSLSLPDQVVEHEDGRYRLVYETTSEVERWNAQLSLCTGMVAAALMVDGGTGILRTLPPAPADVLVALRASAEQLGARWPASMSYPGWVRTLDPTRPRDAALEVAAGRTLRGASYAAFDSATAPLADPPPVHAAIAAPYAHVTAPLRRLVDRYGAECALAAHAGVRPPGWVLDVLAELPEVMERTGGIAGAVDRACVDLVEAAVLAHRVGERIDAVVTTLRHDGSATVQLADPAVIANAAVPPGTRPGDPVAVRVVAADPSTRSLELRVDGGPSGAARPG